MDVGVERQDEAVLGEVPFDELICHLGALLPYK